MRNLVIALLCILAPIASARAGWEATEWGMSPRKVVEVLRASGAEPGRWGYDAMVLKRLSSSSNTLIFVRDYDWRGHTFELRFGFDSRGELNRVFLVSAEDRFDRLERMLADAYGEPTSAAETPLRCRQWIDPTRGDSIRLRYISSIVVERMPASGNEAVRCWGSGHQPASVSSGRQH